MKSGPSQTKVEEKKLSPRSDKLRQLIQMEINYALQVEDSHGYRFAHEIREANDHAWKDFDTLFAPVEEKEDGM